jgi:CDP-6-deoxy-D-xylo-4-hexulose-3-dehydrase
MGEQCRNFELAFAEKQECAEAVFVGSGSAANLVLVQALLNLGILNKGDKIAFSALTWATNIMPLIQLGLEPVAIDCEKSDLNISPATLAPHLGEVKGLFLTNVLGFANDVGKIKQLCREHGIVFFEDNCESLGSKIDGTLLGNFGMASTFSFFIGHHMSTIEGGMVCTDDHELADMIRMVRAHGWDRNLSPETQRKLRRENKVDDFFAKYTFYDLAYNTRPSEINGVLGNSQLRYLDEIVRKRAENFSRFREAAGTNPDILPLSVGHMQTVSNFAMPIICRDEETFKRYRRRFEGADVEIRPIIAGDMSRQPFYAKYVKNVVPCPNAEFIHKNGFYFGNNPELTDDEIDLLVTLLKP